MNGEVEALALAGNTLYVGGDFTQISPKTGPLIALRRSTGDRLAGFPRVEAGEVNSVVDDGHGGWFAGGEFERVGGVPCANLVHITRTMRVRQSWCPRPGGEVTTLARRGSTLFVGGELQRIGGRSRRALAAVDTRTGRALAWNPDPDYFVTDLEVHERTLYVLGDFREIGGKPHGSLAAVDAVTGVVHDWDPRPPFDEDHGDALVRDIAVSDTAVYGAGSLLVAYDRDDGRSLPWDPLPQNGYASAIEVHGERLYVGGIFSRMAGERRSNLAAFGADSRLLTAWSPKAQPVSELSVQGTGVFTVENAGIRSYDADSGRRGVLANPRPNDVVHALAASGSTVVVAGRFDGAAGVTRNGLAALDVRTGEPTSWNPRLAGGQPREAVYSVVTDGSTVYVGGLFKRAGGVRRNGLVALDAATGRPTTLVPAISGYSVDSLALGESALYVAGDFDSASGYGNAAFDLSSGLLLDWYPTAGYLPMVVHDDSVILGGRSLVSVDAETGKTLEWETRTTVFRVPSIDAIAVSEGRVFFAGRFEKVAGEPREGIAAADADTGGLLAWDPGVDFSFTRALTVDGDAVYVGGFDGLRVVHRESAETLLTYAQLADERVDAIVVTGATVFVGTENGLRVVSAAPKTSG